MIEHDRKDVFISYASHDRERVVPIVNTLEGVGVSVWRDQSVISGGECYGPVIVNAIKNAKVLMLMCSHASLQSKNVNQEIRLAWKYNVPYLPLLLDPINFTAQVEYWLEGNQWIEVLDRPQQAWLPGVVRSLKRAGVLARSTEEAAQGIVTRPSPIRLEEGLDGLRAAAKFTDQIWPVLAGATQRGMRSGVTRGLGAPQSDARHRFPLGSRIRLIIESNEERHLLLLDESPDGTVYCLCPSLFAPDTNLGAGQTVLPQPQSRYESFLVTGATGREQLLAILTDKPIRPGWTTHDHNSPARTLRHQDIDGLITELKSVDADQWLALATYFDVTPV